MTFRRIVVLGLGLLSLAARAPAQDGRPPSSVKELCRSSRALRHEGRPEAALELLAAARVSGDARVLAEELLALLDGRRSGEARQRLAGLHLPAQHELPFPLVVAQARLSLAEGESEHAKQLAERAFAERPDGLDARVLEFELLVDGGRFDAAGALLGELSDALGERRRDDLQAALLRARAARLLEDDHLERAVALLDEARARAPWRGDVAALAVDALLRWHRLEEAEELVARALEASAEVDHPELLYAQGSVHRERQRLDEARACFERVLEIRPGHGAAEVALARCLARTGGKDQAVALLRASLERRGAQVEALLVLADLLEAEGDLHGAEGALRHVLDQRPNNRKVLWRLSRIKARQGDMGEVEALVARYQERAGQLADR